MLMKVKTANTTLKDKIYRREGGITFADLSVGTEVKERRSKRTKKTEERKEKGFGPLYTYLTPTNTRKGLWFCNQQTGQVQMQGEG